MATDTNAISVDKLASSTRESFEGSSELASAAVPAALRREIRPHTAITYTAAANPYP